MNEKISFEELEKHLKGTLGSIDTGVVKSENYLRTELDKASKKEAEVKEKTDKLFSEIKNKETEQKKEFELFLKKQEEARANKIASFKKSLEGRNTKLVGYAEDWKKARAQTQKIKEELQKVVTMKGGK